MHSSHLSSLSSITNGKAFELLFPEEKARAYRDKVALVAIGLLAAIAATSLITLFATTGGPASLSGQIGLSVLILGLCCVAAFIKSKYNEIRVAERVQKNTQNRSLITWRAYGLINTNNIKRSNIKNFINALSDDDFDRLVKLIDKKALEENSEETAGGRYVRELILERSPRPLYTKNPDLSNIDNLSLSVYKYLLIRLNESNRLDQATLTLFANSKHVFANSKRVNEFELLQLRLELLQLRLLIEKDTSTASLGNVESALQKRIGETYDALEESFLVACAKREKVDPQQKALLEELAHHPQQMAMFVLQKYHFQKEEKALVLLDALWKTINETERELFNKKIVKGFKELDPKELGEQWVDMMENVPAAFLGAMAQTPIAFAHAVKKLGNNYITGAYKFLEKHCNESDQEVFYSTLKDIDKALYDQLQQTVILTEKAKEAASAPSREMDDARFVQLAGRIPTSKAPTKYATAKGIIRDSRFSTLPETTKKQITLMLLSDGQLDQESYQTLAEKFKVNELFALLQEVDPESGKQFLSNCPEKKLKALKILIKHTCTRVERDPKKQNALKAFLFAGVEREILQKQDIPDFLAYLPKNQKKKVNNELQKMFKKKIRSNN